MSWEAEAPGGRCCSSAAARVAGRGCSKPQNKALQTDRQTDVESRKLEIKVGAVASACLAGTPHAHFQAWKSDNTEAAGL